MSFYSDTHTHIFIPLTNGNAIMYSSFIMFIFFKAQETKILHQLVHFANACSSWGWARKKPRTRNSIWALTWVARTQVLQLHPQPARLNISRMLNSEAEALRLQLGSAIWNICITRGNLIAATDACDNKILTMLNACFKI